MSEKPTNPNNCQTCDWKRNPDGGWCYMFRDEPTETCYVHTGREKPLRLVAARDEGTR